MTDEPFLYTLVPCMQPDHCVVLLSDMSSHTYVSLLCPTPPHPTLPTLYEWRVFISVLQEYHDLYDLQRKRLESRIGEGCVEVD